MQSRTTRPCLVFACLGLATIVAGIASPAHAVVIRVATTGSDVATCGSVATPCRSLQYAIDLASNDDEIRLAGGTYTGVSSRDGHVQLASIRSKRVTVRGGFSTSNWSVPSPDTNPTILDAQGQGMVVYITYQQIGIGSIRLEGLRITGGNATDSVSGEDDGGGVHIDTTVHHHVYLDNCRIYGNFAESGAGGVLSHSSVGLWVSDSRIESNSGHGIKTVLVDVLSVTDTVLADHPGAGVLTGVGAPAVTITGNSVLRNAPGLRLSSVSGVIADNLIEDNTASGTGGGGINIAGAVGLTVSGNLFIGNEGTSGGALRITGPAATTVQDNLAMSNSAPFSGYSGGGGFYIDAGATGADADVLGNTVVGNTTVNQGGGMLLLGNVYAAGNLIADNSAHSGGGMTATITGTLEENSFFGNTAQIGGGLSLVNPMGASLVRNVFRGNQATNGDGGGAWIWGGFFFDVALDGNQAVGNSATGRGGGVYLESQVSGSETDILNTLVAENVATTGSGMHIFGGVTTLLHSTIANNATGVGDGVGLYLKQLGSTGQTDIANSIIVGNDTGVSLHSGTATLDRTLWGTGDWSNGTDWLGGVVTGNDTWSAPGFLGPHNYHLASGSPARDAGSDGGVLLDMDGENRPDTLAGVPDLGADELTDPDLVLRDGFESGDISQW